MAREFGRSQRVAEQIQRELATIIQRDLKDPRVGMVTVSAVEVSRDLAYATVFVTFLNRDSKEEISDTLKVLQNAASCLRREIGRAIRMRITPHLNFKYDASLVHGRELSSLIDEARARDSDSTLDSDGALDSDSNGNG